jgi:uncharacterized protein (DUF2235 family)
MKRICIFCDGTWNRADQETGSIPCPTNVVKLAYRTAKQDGNASQLIFYDQGVGTGNMLDRISGGAFGEGLEDNVLDAYRFLIANYLQGDELFIFGFSRGAFTARSLVGMIRKCGIVRRDSIVQYRDAVKLYHNELHPDDPEPTKFREQYAVGGLEPTRVKFIGVWDTVGALGIPLRGLRWLTRQDFQFHDTELSGIVQNAFHALAIDEHRAPFEPTLWSSQRKEGQKVEQAWFCGVHSDVGGGYAETGLSDISLEWMMSKAVDAGLVLDTDACRAYPLSPDPRAKPHNSKRGLFALTLGIHRDMGLLPKLPDADLSRPRQRDMTQSVHSSVLKRWDEDPSYRPEQLRRYFKLIGDLRGDSGNVAGAF